MTEEKQNVVLIIGSCCMDRLLTVERYPRADEKIRTTSYREEGGGNGSNTAAAMGLLSSASFLKEKKLRIKFLGKVGADVVGDQLIHELNDSFNVDTSSPLFRRGEAGTTTGITNVIVSEDEHTRTCIHTPGTCGELTIEEAKAVDMDEIFRDVVHFHSDSRHTEVSVYLAEQAQLRGIPVSCDSERDRGTRFQDRLVEICDTLFCNSDYLADYLGKLNREHESRNGCQSLPEPQIELKGDGLSQTSVNIHAKALLPSAFFSRWHSQGEKEVIVSQGAMGSLRYIPTSISRIKTEARLEDPNNLIELSSASRNTVCLKHQYFDYQGTNSFLVNDEYLVNRAGIVPGLKIVDSTGAGDSFIGAFLLSRFFSQEIENPIQFGLQFGAWVAGRKLEGPGSRTTLPKGTEVDKVLGKDIVSVQSTLERVVTTFNGD